MSYLVPPNNVAFAVSGGAVNPSGEVPVVLPPPAAEPAAAAARDLAFTPVADTAGEATVAGFAAGGAGGATGTAGIEGELKRLPMTLLLPCEC